MSDDAPVKKYFWDLEHAEQEPDAKFLKNAQLNAPDGAKVVKFYRRKT